jgi:hypothetical protein
MILIGLALSATIYPLMQGRKSGWPAWTFIMLGAGALLLGAFMLWERHQPGDPLIQPALLANRTYTNGILVVLAFFGAFSGVLLCVSLFGQLGEGWSPIRAGLTLTAMVIGMIVGMGASFGLVARLGCHLLHVGIALLGAGAIVLALTVTGAHTASTLGLAPAVSVRRRRGDYDGAAVRLRPAGVGMDEAGSAAGVLQAVQQLSSAAGVGALGTIFFSSPRRPPADKRTRDHRLGVPGPGRRRVRAHLPTADARPRATDLTGRRRAVSAGRSGWPRRPAPKDEYTLGALRIRRGTRPRTNTDRRRTTRQRPSQFDEHYSRDAKLIYAACAWGDGYVEGEESRLDPGWRKVPSSEWRLRGSPRQTCPTSTRTDAWIGTWSVCPCFWSQAPGSRTAPVVTRCSASTWPVNC